MSPFYAKQPKISIVSLPKYKSKFYEIQAPVLVQVVEKVITCLRVASVLLILAVFVIVILVRESSVTICV